ncbi:MAG: thiolase family protein [Rickettsiales bacterium]
MEQAVIVAFARSAFTPAHKGGLASVRPDDMLAAVMKASVERARVDPCLIEDAIVGCAFPEGEQGLNVARIAVFLAGLPETTAGVTMNRFCGSSMQAVHMAAGNIALKAGDAYLAGGVESMTRIPMGGFAPMPHPGLYERYPDAYESMGITAENLAEKYGISRDEQESFALESQRRASTPEALEASAKQIIPIPNENGEIVNKDECPRPRSAKADMAKLAPAFKEGGTVTAATSSPLTDGATCMVVCSASFAKAHNLVPMAKIRAVSVSGCAPGIMGIGPVEATRKVLKSGGVALSDVDVIELNEAFAAQSLAVIRELRLDPDKTNMHGGAIALGHPLGASGARIVGKAAELLRKKEGRFALSTMCVGGGQGVATLLEACE